MSLIAVGGATVLDLPDALEAGFGPVTAAQVGWGAVVAAVVGLLSLRLLLLFLRQLRLAPFALYTGALGVVTLLLNR
jgi:undecaprenyl pyrophosphate phosphatase UppP